MFVVGRRRRSLRGPPVRESVISVLLPREKRLVDLDRVLPASGERSAMLAKSNLPYTRYKYDGGKIFAIFFICTLGTRFSQQSSPYRRFEIELPRVSLFSFTIFFFFIIFRKTSLPDVDGKYHGTEVCIVNTYSKMFTLVR